MMLKKLMNNGIATVVAVGAMALVGCEQNSGSGNNGGSAAAPAGDTGHDAMDAASNAATNAANNAADTASNAASSGATDSLELDDSSADGAIYTYVNNLKAGNFFDAAKICVESAPGTAELLKLGENFKSMEEDPANASIGATAKALFLDDFKTIEVNKVLEEDGVVVYEVGVVNKAPLNIRVENRDGAWRVIPPTNGTPLG